MPEIREKSVLVHMSDNLVVCYQRCNQRRSVNALRCPRDIWDAKYLALSVTYSPAVWNGFWLEMTATTYSQWDSTIQGKFSGVVDLQQNTSIHGFCTQLSFLRTLYSSSSFSLQIGVQITWIARFFAGYNFWHKSFHSRGKSYSMLFPLPVLTCTT